MKKIADFFGQSPKSPLFHYTTAEGFLSILDTKELWATSVRHLNDSSEFVHALEKYSKHFEEVVAKKLHSTINPVIDHMLNGAKRIAETDIPAHVISFSEQGNQLSQWRAYSRGMNGISIGFGPDHFIFKNPNFKLVKCVYTDYEHNQLCEALIESLAEREKRMDGHTDKDVKEFEAWAYDFAYLASAIKSEGFQEEQEWRLICLDRPNLGFRSGRFGIVPYLKLPLTSDYKSPIEFSQIVIGQNVATQALRKLH